MNNDNSHKYNTRSKKRMLEHNSSSDSDNNSDSDIEVENMDLKEYREFLAQLFPSNYMKEKASLTPSFKQTKYRNTIKPRKKNKNASEEEILYQDSEPTNYNIVLTVVEKPSAFETEASEAEASEDKYEVETEEVDASEAGETDEESETEAEADEDDSDYVPSATPSESEEETDEEISEEDQSANETDQEDDNSPQVFLIESNNGKLTNAQVDKAIEDIIHDIFGTTKPNRRNAISDIKDNTTNAKEERLKHRNVEKYRIMLNKNRPQSNDFHYFQNVMTVEQQANVLQKMQELQSASHSDKPQQITLIEANIPLEIKASAFRRLNSLNNMDPGANEYHKLKNWVDTFMQIPFNNYKNLNVTIDDGVEKCHEFMENAKQTLDKAVYGLNDAKLQIMQMIGQWIVNPDAIGTAIAIKGPPGTGKTTLVKDGISKILNRDFAFIALGGATDSCFLEGHSYTYEGSTWGKIVDILIKCKSMNPVIYFDELDKVSDTAKGEEIIGILTHLIDTSQNSKFHDKYFSEIDFDLSRCLFIFSYNDESKVNPILKDRMYRIQTKGYEPSQKLVIAKDYLIPVIQAQVKFNKDDIIIPDETLTYIINNHTDKEDGVRNLKRCLEIIYTKLNLYRLMKPDANLFETDMTLKVEFPFEVTNQVVDKLIKKEKENNGAWIHMYS